MSILEIFIRRPVTTLSLVLLILILGVSSYYSMAIRQFPKVTIPQISINTSFPGGSPALIRGFISTPIEDAISSVEGIDYIEASNIAGKSAITVWLREGYPADKALTQINARVTSILWRLPKGALNPQIKKNDRETPVIFYNLSSNIFSSEHITQYIKHTLVPQLKSIQGVKEVLVHSKKNYAMHIWLDPKKMAAHDIVATDVEHAIQNNNVQVGVGSLKGENHEYSVHSNGTLKNADEFNNLVLGWEHGRLIRIKDVAKSVLGSENQDVDTIVPGYKNAIAFGAIASDGVSNIALAARVKKSMQAMRHRLPAGMHLKVLWNTSRFSELSIKLVYSTIWLAIACVIVVIFIFLGSLRVLIIPISLIPLCIIGSFTLMHLSGFTINVLTLLAFVLSIGLVVDDSIVIIENVHRHLHMGKTRFEASLQGTQEILHPIIAMTLVVAAVFIPIGFVSGITGVMFKEFSFTVTYTVLLSGLFALILSPLMCCYILPKQPSVDSFSNRIDNLFDKISSGYKVLLYGLIKIRYVVLLFTVIFLAILYYLFTITPSELMPNQNQGVVLFVAKGPTSSSIYYTNKYANKLAKILKNVPEKYNFAILTGANGVNTFAGYLILRPHQKGDRNESAIIDSLRPKMNKIIGMNVFPMNRPPLADITGIHQPVQFVIQTTGSYASLAHVMNRLIAAAHKNPNILNIRTNLLINKPQINLTINRDRAGSLGVSVKNISETLRMLLGEPIISWFDHDSWSYPVIPMIEKKYRNLPQNLKDVYVKQVGSGDLIPLSNLVSFSTVAAPQSLNQFQLLNSARLEASLKHGYTMSEAVTFLKHVTNPLLTNNMQYNFAGATRDFVQSQGKTVFVFIAALIAIYLMLAIKFNSFTDPLIVMISVPLSLLGALLCMHLKHYSLNIYTQIGLVMLIGLISKHGILIVNFANRLQLEGKSRVEAVVTSASIRLRPVLMTTFAMVLGALPLCLVSSLGSLPLNQIGLVIIGGLSFGSLLTLFIVPTFYTFLSRHSIKSKATDHQD